MTGRSNLLLLDGVRMNNSTWRSGPVQYWNTLDSYSVDHLELIKSQGSVPFGSDAIGGTLTAAPGSDVRVTIRVRVSLMHGSATLSARAAQEIRLGMKRPGPHSPGCSTLASMP